jgi:lipoprotein-anchoring transpeptidase ErfK/SrfK
VDDKLQMPFAFVIRRGASTWKLIRNRDVARPAEPIPFRSIVPLSGKVRIKDGRRFHQARAHDTHWLQADDVGVVSEPPAWPAAAEKGERWIDVSLRQQTLALYEGKRAVYATLVSSGQDRLGDPAISKATPRGEFRIRSKHISAAMDSNESSTVFGGQRTGNAAPALPQDLAGKMEDIERAEREGRRLSDDDRRRLENARKGRHPEYGVTMRRGSHNYELRDVPWIQYFAAGYALHGAYWHDVFGTPRSHGCINLSPIDARAAFLWTEPSVPEGWHGINSGPETGEGTVLVVRE